MNVTVKTQGFKELEQLFRALPEQVQSTVLGAGTLAGARYLAKAAKAAAPRHVGKQSASSKKYGTGRQNIKAKPLRKRYRNKRAAMVYRDRAFWLDLLNRGTRYIPATRWYETAFDSAVDGAVRVMKDYMVAKVTQLSLRAINRFGANKK